MVLNTVSLSTGRYKGSQQVEEMVSVIINDAKQTNINGVLASHFGISLLSPISQSISHSHTMMLAGLNYDKIVTGGK